MYVSQGFSFLFSCQSVIFAHKTSTMDRIFHARIAWYHYLILAVATCNAVGALWYKHVLIALCWIILLIIFVEMIIHTAYTITAAGKLEISRGRFLKKRIIPLTDIHAIEQHRSMRFGHFSVTRYVLVKYGEGKFESLLPVKEQEFIELLKKRKE